jgi:hypothetical protein
MVTNDIPEKGPVLCSDTIIGLALHLAKQDLVNPNAAVPGVERAVVLSQLIDKGLQEMPSITYHEAEASILKDVSKELGKMRINNSVYIVSVLSEPAILPPHFASFSRLEQEADSFCIDDTRSEQLLVINHLAQSHAIPSNVLTQIIPSLRSI